MNPWKWLVGLFRKLWSASKTEAMDDLFALALDVVEAVARVDMNGDDRIMARGEIAAVALQSGQKWGRKFIDEAGHELLELLDESDLKKWLAVARITSAFVRRGTYPPKLSAINLVIEAAVEWIDARAGQS